MVKRIFSLLTALAIVCSLMPAAIVYAADKSEIQLLADLEIIDVTEKATLLPETFTREDFAVALNKIDRNIENFITDGEEEGKYAADIKGNKNYGHIATLIALGYMETDADNNFRPTQPVSRMDVVRALIHALSYDVIAENDGGSDAAYDRISNKLGLLKGVRIQNSSKLTPKEVASILANAMSIKFFPPENVDFGDECFYTKWNIVKRTGKVFANSNLGIATPRTQPHHVNIAGTTYYTKLLVPDELVGANVEYYTTNGDKGNEVVSIYVNEGARKNITLSAGDIENVTETAREVKITYDGKKSVTIPKSGYLLVNGKKLSPAKKYFDAFKSGSITFVDNGSGKYEVAHMTMLLQSVIEGVNAEKETVVLRYDNQTIKLEDVDVYEVYLNNKASELSALTSGMAVGVACDSFTVSSGVITYNYTNAEFIRLYASDNVTEGVVEAMDDEKIYIDDMPITIGAGYRRLVAAGKLHALDLGEYVKAYRDNYGALLYYELDAEKSSMQYGYLIKAGVNASGIKHNLQLKIMDAKGNIDIYSTDKTFTLDGKRKLSANATSYLVGSDTIDLTKRMVVRYKVIDGVLRELDTPTVTSLETTEKTLDPIGYFDYWEHPDSIASNLLIDSKYVTNNKKECFRNVVADTYAVASDAVVFIDEALRTDTNPDDSNFMVTSFPSTDVDEFVIGYDADENNIVKVAAIWKAYGQKDDVAMSDSSTIDNTTNGRVVEKINWALDKNGDEGYKVFLAGNGNKETYFARADKMKLYEIDTAAENNGWGKERPIVKKVDSSKLTDIIGRGDVVRIELNTAGEIAVIERIFDYSAHPNQAGNPNLKEYSPMTTAGSAGGQHWAFVKVEKIVDKFILYKESESGDLKIIARNELLKNNAIYYVNERETEILPHENLPSAATGDEVYMFIRKYASGLKDGILYVYN